MRDRTARPSCTAPRVDVQEQRDERRAASRRRCSRAPRSAWWISTSRSRMPPTSPAGKVRAARRPLDRACRQVVRQPATASPITVVEPRSRSRSADGVGGGQLLDVAVAGLLRGVHRDRLALVHPLERRRPAPRRSGPGGRPRARGSSRAAGSARRTGRRQSRRRCGRAAGCRRRAARGRVTGRPCTPCASGRSAVGAAREAAIEQPSARRERCSRAGSHGERLFERPTESRTRSGRTSSSSGAPGSTTSRTSRSTCRATR